MSDNNLNQDNNTTTVEITDNKETGEIKEGDIIKGTGIFEGLSFEVVEVEK